MVLERDLERRAPREGKLPGQEAVEDDAERVDVRGRPRRRAFRLLGRQVGGGAHDRPGFRERRLAGRPRDAEVGELGAALRVEEDVRGLQVAVDDPVRVRMGEAGGDLGREPLRLEVGQRPTAAEALLERAAAEVFEDEVRPALGLADVVDPGDVRMGQRGDRAGLPDEPRRVGVAREELERHEAPELAVLGQPDLGHAAAAEQVAKLEPVADHLAGHGRLA